jgi:hypothetical protein
MRIQITTPASQPVLVPSDCYLDLRLDASGSPPTNPDDVLLVELIADATDFVQRYTRRALCKESILLTHSRFPYDRVWYRTQETLWSEPNGYDLKPQHIRLLRPDLLALTSVQYYDTNNALQTLDPTLYLVHSDEQAATIELLIGNFWPPTYLREDAVQIAYDAGYTPKVTGSPPVYDYAANIPVSIKRAMKLHIRQHYDPQTPDQWKMLGDGIDGCLTSYRSFNF